MNKLKLIQLILLMLNISVNPLIASNIVESEFLKESTASLSKLHDPLKRTIFSYLEDKKGFIQLSHVSKEWREVAVRVGKDKSLNLSHRSLTKQDCLALMKAPFSALTLNFCKLNKDNLVAIFFQTHSDLTIIKKLVLRGNGLTAANLKCLNNLSFSNIEEIILSDNCIGDEGAKYFSSAKFPYLKVVDVSSNSITAAGIEYLSKMELSNLKELNLSFNPIEYEGAAFLSKAKLSNLRSLNLASTNIRAAGVKIITDRRFPNIELLILPYIYSEGAGIRHLSGHGIR